MPSSSLGSKGRATASCHSSVQEKGGRKREVGSVRQRGKQVKPHGSLREPRYLGTSLRDSPRGTPPWGVRVPQSPQTGVPCGDPPRHITTHYFPNTIIPNSSGCSVLYLALAAHALRAVPPQGLVLGVRTVHVSSSWGNPPRGVQGGSPQGGSPQGGPPQGSPPQGGGGGFVE